MANQTPKERYSTSENECGWKHVPQYGETGEKYQHASNGENGSDDATTDY
jgi:hypothetical protein